MPVNIKIFAMHALFNVEFSAAETLTCRSISHAIYCALLNFKLMGNLMSTYKIFHQSVYKLVDFFYVYLSRKSYLDNVIEIIDKMRIYPIFKIRGKFFKIFFILRGEYEIEDLDPAGSNSLFLNTPNRQYPAC